MQIVTWNVAGLNARLHRVKLWIEENQPDVVCLQETKMKNQKTEAQRRGKRNDMIITNTNLIG